MAAVEEKSDDELVTLALGGSEEAMVELYRRYRRRIMGFAYRMTGDTGLAEDVFHSTFAYFYEHLERYRPEGKLAAYLFRVARSVVADQLRLRRRAEAVAGAGEPGEPAWAFAPPPGPEASGEEAAAAAELQDKARRALLGLPDHLREVVVLRVYEGLDYARIGEVTGAGESTARSRMRYALKQLREAMRARLGRRPET